MAVELATAYVSLVPSAKGISDRIRDELDGPLTKAARRAGEAASDNFVGHFKSGLGKIAGIVGAAFAVDKLKDIGGSALSVAADFQQTRIAFEGMLGSAEAADSFLDRLRGFAAQTPFELPGLLTSSRQLLAVGFSADEVIPSLTRLGNVAAALGANETQMSQVVRALGQIKGKGRVQLEELNQIAEAFPGFNAIGALAAGLGKPIAEVTNELSKPGGLLQSMGLTGDMAASILLDQMERFPGAAGAMDKQSKTLNGVLSTLKDTIRNTAIDAIEPLLPALSSAVEKATPVITGFITKTVNGFLAVGRFAAPVVKEVVAGFKLLVQAFRTGMTEDEVATPFERVGFALRSVAQAVASVDWGAVFGAIKNAIQPVIDAVAGFDFSGNFDRVKAAVGPLLPTLLDLAQAAADLGGKIAAFAIDNAPLFVTAIETVSTVAGPVLSKLVDVVKFLADNFDTLKPVIVAAVAAFATFKTVEGVNSTVDTLKDKVSGLKDGLTSAKDTFVTFKNNAATAASTLANWARGAASAAAAAARTVASAVASAATAMWTSVRAATAAAVAWARQTAATIASRVAAIATTVATHAMTAAQWLLNAAMTANPIGLIIAGIVALAAGLILAYQKSETFRNIVDAIGRFFRDTLWPAIQDVASAIGDKLAPVLHAVWQVITTYVVPAFQAVWAFIRDKVIPVVGDVISRIKEFVRDAKERFEDFKRGVQVVVDEVKSKFDSVVDFITGLPRRIKDAASGMWDGIKDAFRSAINWLIDAWNGLEFRIPGFDPPGPGPKFGGFTLGVPNIPRLASGGVIDAPTVALLGETRRARPEIASPVALLRSIFASELAASAAGAPVQVNQTFNAAHMSPDEAGRKAAWAMKWQR